MSGVPGVPGVTGVPGVPGVSGVPGVFGVSGVPASGQLWAGPEPLEHRGHFSPNRGQGCSGCSRGCLCQIQVSCSRQVGWKEGCRAEGTFLAAMGQEGEGDGQQRWPGLGPHPIQLPAPSSPSLVQTHRNADHGMTTAGTHGGDWSCQDPELKAGLGVGEG